MQEYDVDIAILKEQLGGLREQQKAHAVETRERFEKMENKLSVLIDTLNQGKGAYRIILMSAGLMGALGALGIKLGALLIGK